MGLLNVVPGLNLGDKAELRERDNSGNSVAFQFNPETISFSKNATWKPAGSTTGDAPVMEFVSSTPIQLTGIMMLLDDTQVDITFSKPTTVQKRVKQLMEWLSADPRSDSTTHAPPILVFSWGKLEVGPHKQLHCFLSSLSVNYTLFDREGAAKRAECTLGLQSVRTETPGTNPTSGGPEPVRSFTTQRDDSLAVVSHRQYGKTSNWRAVASYNAVDNPFRVRAGQTMLLPEIRPS